jgi:Xaa-Pro dipeptidase
VTGDLAAIRSRRAGDALAAAGLDAFIVGQPRNLAYLTGTRRVLVRGSRPFAPLAVLLTATGEVWMQSYSTGDIPVGVADRLYPQVWNPQRLVDNVAGILGPAGAGRVGVDSMTPAWRARLVSVLPSVRLVPADALLRRLRARKTPEELPSLRRAVAAAATAMAAACAAAAGGATEAEVRARLAAAVVSSAATLPSEGVCAVLEEGCPLRRLPDRRVIHERDLVALDVSASVDGYEAGAGRTVAAGAGGGGSAGGRWEEVLPGLVAACRAGAAGGDILAAAAGLERDPALPFAYWYGFGPEAPIAPGDELAAGEVLAVQARGWEPGSPGWFARDMILVGDHEGELLTGDIPL